MTGGQPLSARVDLYDGAVARRRLATARLEADALALDGLDGAPLGRWPLATLRRVPGSRRPGGAARAELRLMRDDGDPARLVLRDPTLVVALAALCPRLERLPTAPGWLGRMLALWGALAIVAVVFTVFVAAPMLADRIAPMISPDRERALGETLANEVVGGGLGFLGAGGGVCETADGRAALDKMVARLEAVAGAHLPLTVRVIPGDDVNAFAFPGGQIFVMDGLLRNAVSADEVAGVLAHEIGHVVARDPTRAALRGFASGVIVSYVLGDFVGGFVAIGMANAVIDARYSREAEAGADAIAVGLMEKAGVPAAPLAGFFAKLRDLYGDGGGYLDTHPMSSAREAVFRAAAERFGETATLANRPPVLGSAEWYALQTMCDG